MPTINNPSPVAAFGNPAAVGRNGMGTAALVLGIVAIVLSWTVIGGIMLGILAVIFGIVGRSRVKRGEADNRRTANAGIITGVVGIVLAGGLIALGITIVNSPAGKNLQHCLKNANGNKAAVSQCDTQYAHSH